MEIKKTTHKKNERGLSQIVSAVLLIVITLTLATIVFVWGKSLYEGKIITYGDENIDSVCDKIVFRADYDLVKGWLLVSNDGNIKIDSIMVKGSGQGTIENFKIGDKLSIDDGVGSGELKSFSISSLLYTGSVAKYTEINVIPILIGKADDKTLEYVCKDSTGKIIKLK